MVCGRSGIDTRNQRTNSHVYLISVISADLILTLSIYVVMSHIQHHASAHVSRPATDLAVMPFAARAPLPMAIYTFP